MTKPGSNKPGTNISTPAKAPRESRSSKEKAALTADPCELFLEELRARRERLQQLLGMIHLEAGRSNAGRTAERPRGRKCSGGRRANGA